MSLATLLAGALAGLLATLPMTVAMEAMHRYLPFWERQPLPPWQITMRVARAVGLHRRTEREQKRGLTMLAHFGYGAAAGALYAPLARALRASGALGANAYSPAVWAGSYVGWLPERGDLSPSP